jgi:ABC-type sugar transport system substrate-binding protein
MSKTVFALLLGNKEGEPADLYQQLQQKEALAHADPAGLKVEVACAPGFDQYRVLRKRLGDAASPVDAVITEPANASTMGLMLKELKGKTGCVLLNVWDSVVEGHVDGWGSEVPIGVVSTPHATIGEIQGRQVSAVVPPDGAVLVVTGPSRSSAAPERLAGLRSTIRPDITVADTEAGQWTEADGILAFNAWYGVFKTRHEEIHAIAGQSDDVAVGARQASLAVPDAAHAAMFAKAKLFGAGGCPGFGKDRVDDGTLDATIAIPPNTGMAITLLKRYWAGEGPFPRRSFTEVRPYPGSSVGAS